MTSDDLTTVATFSSVVEAEMARSVLEASGIESYIHAPHANALYPGVLGEVRLQVKKSDLETAGELLEKEEN